MQMEAAAPALTFARPQQSRVYDLLMRLPLLGWCALCATLQIAGLGRYMREADPALASAVYAINTAMRLSTIGFLLLLAAAVILRARPAGKARGLEPRVSAFIGAFLIYAIPYFPRRELSLTAELVATLLILIGSAGAIVVLLRLGRSFSMMAEARRLVTSGVYRLVRHPLYLAEELAIIGIFMQFLSVWTALILALQIAFQLRRMHNEEVVLTQTFPVYAAYRQQTCRLIPGIY
jgi:protein-S-isoprenylcysteine O-methyltransferase Ste14